MNLKTSTLLCALILVVSCLAPAAALAGYAWSAVNHKGDVEREYNSVGEGNEARRAGVGDYRLSFPGVGNGPGLGNIQITTHGLTYGHCKLRGWFIRGGDVEAVVNCYGADGEAESLSFSAIFHQHDDPERKAIPSIEPAYGPLPYLPWVSYLVADRPYQSGDYTSAGWFESVIPSSKVRGYDPSRGLEPHRDQVIHRIGVGRYALTSPYWAYEYHTGLVTAVGTDSTRCIFGELIHHESWPYVGSYGDYPAHYRWEVVCRGPDGERRDSAFHLAWSFRSTLIPDHQGIAAVPWFQDDYVSAGSSLSRTPIGAMQRYRVEGPAARGELFLSAANRSSACTVINRLEITPEMTDYYVACWEWTEDGEWRLLPPSEFSPLYQVVTADRLPPLIDIYLDPSPIDPPPWFPLGGASFFD